MVKSDTKTLLATADKKCFLLQIIINLIKSSENEEGKVNESFNVNKT